MSTKEHAQQLATEAHAGQFRWDGKTPYITHPAAVADLVWNAVYDDYHIHSATRAELATQVAWLHDVVEDTNVTIQQLRDEGFDGRVIRAVNLITKRKEDDDYCKYIARVSLNEFATIVKLYDIHHNCLDIKEKLPKNKQRYDKYRLAQMYLLKQFDGSANLDNLRHSL